MFRSVKVRPTPSHDATANLDESGEKATQEIPSAGGCND